MLTVASITAVAAAAVTVDFKNDILGLLNAGGIGDVSCAGTVGIPI